MSLWRRYWLSRLMCNRAQYQKNTCSQKNGPNHGWQRNDKTLRSVAKVSEGVGSHTEHERSTDFHYRRHNDGQCQTDIRHAKERRKSYAFRLVKRNEQQAGKQSDLQPDCSTRRAVHVSQFHPIHSPSHFGINPRLPIFSTQKSVGFFIADDALFLTVPINTAAQLQREHSQ